MALAGGGGGQEGRAAAPSPPSEGAGQREAAGHAQPPSFIFPLRPPPQGSGRQRPSLLALDERSKRTVCPSARPPVGFIHITDMHNENLLLQARKGWSPGQSDPAPRVGERTGDAQPGQLPIQHAALALPGTKPHVGGTLWRHGAGTWKPRPAAPTSAVDSSTAVGLTWDPPQQGLAARKRTEEEGPGLRLHRTTHVCLGKSRFRNK